MDGQRRRKASCGLVRHYSDEKREGRSGELTLFLKSETSGDGKDGQRQGSLFAVAHLGGQVSDIVLVEKVTQ